MAAAVKLSALYARRLQIHALVSLLSGAVLEVGGTRRRGGQKTFTEDYERLLTEADLSPLPRAGEVPDLLGPSHSGSRLADGSECRMRHTKSEKELTHKLR